MRKILALILSLVVCVGMFSLVGCGDGNYQEVSAQEIMQIAEQMDAVEIDGPLMVDLGNGLELDFALEMSYGGYSYKTNLNAKFKRVDQNIEYAAILSGVAPEGTNNASMYYKDGYLYSANNFAGGVVKTKQKYNLGEAFDQIDLESFSQGLYEMDDLIEEMQYIGDALKCYIDKSGDTTKIKIEIKMEEAGETMSMVMKYEIDAGYKLISYSADVNMGSMGTLTASMAPWSGTIDFPSDLETYMPIA